jgi:hypothetical protein
MSDEKEALKKAVENVAKTIRAAKGMGSRGTASPVTPEEGETGSPTPETPPPPSGQSE